MLLLCCRCKHILKFEVKLPPASDSEAIFQQTRIQHEVLQGEDTRGLVRVSSHSQRLRIIDASAPSEAKELMIVEAAYCTDSLKQIAQACLAAILMCQCSDAHIHYLTFQSTLYQCRCGHWALRLHAVAQQNGRGTDVDPQMFTSRFGVHAVSV